MTTPTPAPAPALERAAGWLAIVHALMFLVPVTVLGAAIGWPANLDMPAAHNLPLVLSESVAVKLGYGVYLLYSILFFPAILLIARVLAGRDALPVLLRLAVGFALVSMLARCLGIVRWLSVMPVLAARFETADPAAQAGIALVYDAFNAYSGRVGEVLGVFLFAAAAVCLLAVAMWRDATVPKWLSGMGLATAAGLGVLALELFGLDMGPLIAPVSIVYMAWMVLLGVFLLRRPRR